MSKRISKTQYLMGLQCPKRLWLYNHRRDLVPPPDAALQGLFDEGHAVDELLRLALPGGELALTWRKDGHVLMSGPTALSYRGRLDTGMAA